MTWTVFEDMYSGGRAKLEAEYIYVEASKEEAKKVFRSHTGLNPDNTTCECCGRDYVIYEYDSLEEASSWRREHIAQERHNDSTPISMDEYLMRQDIMVIYKTSF
jgi:hypothetical protein